MMTANRQRCFFVYPSLIISVLFLHNTLAWITPTFFCTSLSHQLTVSMTSSTDEEAIPSKNNTTTTRIRILGVGGGIGSGKSTACKLLSNELGCMAHIDADTVAHTVYQPESQCLKEIAGQFGSDLIQENGELDRKKLGSIVFSDRSEMKKLEHIVWPHTKQAILQNIDGIKKGYTPNDSHIKYPIIIVEAAMLLDADWNEFVDGIWIVTTSLNNALTRLIETRNLTREEAQKRIDAQVSRRGVGNLADEVQTGHVSAVVDNNGDLETLRQSLETKLNDPAAWYS